PAEAALAHIKPQRIVLVFGLEPANDWVGLGFDSWCGAQSDQDGEDASRVSHNSFPMSRYDLTNYDRSCTTKGDFSRLMLAANQRGTRQHAYPRSLNASRAARRPICFRRSTDGSGHHMRKPPHPEAQSDHNHRKHSRAG